MAAAHAVPPEVGTIENLGRVVRVADVDLKRCFGYRPWLLETLVDESEHSGAS